LPHTQGYYDDDRSTDEGMHRIKPGQYFLCLLPPLDCYGGHLVNNNNKIFKFFFLLLLMIIIWSYLIFPLLSLWVRFIRDIYQLIMMFSSVPTSQVHPSIYQDQVPTMLYPFRRFHSTQDTLFFCYLASIGERSAITFNTFSILLRRLLMTPPILFPSRLSTTNGEGYTMTVLLLFFHSKISSEDFKRRFQTKIPF